MIIIACLWLLIAFALIVYLWPDIWFTAAELDDQWAAFVLIAIALTWPISIAYLAVHITLEYWNSK